MSANLICKKNYALFFLLFLSSCSGKNHYPHLYDKSGFESGSRPVEDISGTVAKVSPDYYRQTQYPPQTQQQYAPPQQMPPEYQQQAIPPQPIPPQPMPPQAAPVYVQAAPYSPYSQNPYVSSYQVPGSRFYANPYAIPPSPYYMNYDVDQHYVPPTSHNAVESLPQGRARN